MGSVERVRRENMLDYSIAACICREDRKTEMAGILGDGVQIYGTGDKSLLDKTDL